MNSFNPQWNQLGLYYIPSEGHYQSYFLKRSWGNYLFFPHPNVDQMFPFILASGGIYKVFDSTLPYPGMNKKLFDKFGAPTIGVQREHHEDFLIESFPSDYFDVDLEIKASQFILKIKRDPFCFLDAGGEKPLVEMPILNRLKD
ncbi:MAG: hypothetical protein K2P81_01265 [Bacteriovoracaceae bacterium]|nr:hypothetical protein [Bacteriovoracaceae bacterium]